MKVDHKPPSLLSALPHSATAADSSRAAVQLQHEAVSTYRTVL